MRREYQTVSVTVAAICSLFFLSNFSANDAHAHGKGYHQEAFHDWVGEWGCSFQISDPPAGPQVVLTQLTIDSNGNATSVTKTATLFPPPFNEINCTATGTISELRDHYIRYEVVGRCPLEGSEVEFEQQAECIGLMNEGNGYTELNCIDLTDEPDEENREHISLATCKKVYPGDREDFLNH